MVSPTKRCGAGEIFEGSGSVSYSDPGKHFCIGFDPG